MKIFDDLRLKYKLEFVSTDYRALGDDPRSPPHTRISVKNLSRS